MPQVFRIGAYLVYFGLNEGMPLEPIHVHIEEGTPIQNGTKIWLTKREDAFWQIMHRKFQSVNYEL